MKLFFTVLICIATFFCSNAQSAHELNEKLGPGINMGNMFEAPDENAWGNPFRDDYFERIATLGFKHVRIPITWDVPARAMQENPYTINPDFLARVKYVVDKAQASGLMAIINMHHHESVFQNPEDSRLRFLSQWKQISTHFKDYNENLFFEVLNEPHGNLSPAKWNSFFEDALKVIRETNPSRIVLLGVAEYGGLAGLPHLKVPEDSRLILSIHYYEPFRFTHQGAEWSENSDEWLGTEWQNTDMEREAIEDQFQYAIDFSAKHNIPINIGEFGAYNKADMKSRTAWTNYLARWSELQGFSWTYWEFSAGFGIFDPIRNLYIQPLVNALLHDSMTAAVVTKKQTVYQSDFTFGNDGWVLQTVAPAAAVLNRENSNLTVQINKSSAESWHIQLVKNNFSLKRNMRYRLSVEGYAGQDMGINAYVGMSVSPWSSYSGFSNVTFTQSKQRFRHTFVMDNTDDKNARLVFDIGSKTGKLVFTSVLLEEIQDVEVILKNEDSKEIKLFPNPAEEVIGFSGIKEGEKGNLINGEGKVLRALTDDELKHKKVSVKNLNPGHYFLKFSDKSLRFIVP